MIVRLFGGGKPKDEKKVEIKHPVEIKYDQDRSTAEMINHEIHQTIAFINNVAITAQIPTPIITKTNLIKLMEVAVNKIFKQACLLKELFNKLTMFPAGNFYTSEIEENKIALSNMITNLHALAIKLNDKLPLHHTIGEEQALVSNIHNNMNASMSWSQNNLRLLANYGYQPPVPIYTQKGPGNG